MSVLPLSTEDEVDLWKLGRFTDLGFDSSEIACLLFWGTSPHDVESLLYQAGRRTVCTHAQALRIVRPLELVVATESSKLPACVVCMDDPRANCEFCPKSK